MRYNYCFITVILNHLLMLHESKSWFSFLFGDVQNQPRNTFIDFAYKIKLYFYQSAYELLKKFSDIQLLSFLPQETIFCKLPCSKGLYLLSYRGFLSVLLVGRSLIKSKQASLSVSLLFVVPGVLSTCLLVRSINLTK